MTSNEPGRHDSEEPAAREMADPRRETAHVEHAVIDIEHADITPGARRAARHLAWSLIVLFTVTIGLLAASFLFTNGQVHAVRENTAAITRQAQIMQRQIRADCGWYRDVAQLPVTMAPGSRRPTIVLPRLISDSRAAWHGHACPGQIPPADPSFVKWAAFYHLPVN